MSSKKKVLSINTNDASERTPLINNTQNNNGVTSPTEIPTPKSATAKQQSVQNDKPLRKPYVPHREDPQFNRMKYYSKITTEARKKQTEGETSPSEIGEADEQQSETSSTLAVNSPFIVHFEPPVHVVPEELMYGAPNWLQKFSSSLSLIFSVWNTMMGSTLLTIPWAFRESGVVLGFLLFIFVGIVSYYTCSLVVVNLLELQKERMVRATVVSYNAAEKTEITKKRFLKQQDLDFSDVCVEYMGKWSQILATLISCIILVGASIAYHIFMKDSLALIVEGFFGLTVKKGLWYWSNYMIPVYLALAVFPFVMLKNLNLLAKLNSFGIVFVFLLLGFVVYACVKAFINPSSTVPYTPHTNLVDHLTYFNKDWSHLLGVLSLSFFIHNVVASILRNNQSNLNARAKAISNKRALRDIAIAYVLAGFCYLLPGMLVAFAFRYAPDIKDNFLNQFPSSDLIANIARCFVLAQLISIFPLLIYVIRVQLFTLLFKNAYPNFLAVFVLNFMLLAATTACAAFFAKAGFILRYTGAFCGLILLYLLPIIVHLMALKKQGRLGFFSVAFHVLLILLGTTTLILQFI